MGEIRVEWKTAEAVMSAVLVLPDILRVPWPQRLNTWNSSGGKKLIDIYDRSQRMGYLNR